MQTDKDPIVARASASGRGGVGIVRVSGDDNAIQGIASILFPEKELKARHAHLFSVKDSSDELIDNAIVLYFKGPHSYTGESVLELQAHGGQAVLEKIIQRILDVGKGYSIRLARAGEFTERAFLNGRMDLTQAEAVADLIDAKSSAAARAAARSLQGVFSEKVKALNERLIDLRGYVEATLDFPEDEVDFIHEGRITEKVNALLLDIENLEKKAMRGKVLREGLSVVLVGEPNVGKSSLMNALAGEDVSIVTEIAGTTRDKIDYEITVDGVLLRITDTAGLHETTDTVETIGIQRAIDAVSRADVVLCLQDAQNCLTGENKKVLSMISPYLREGVQFVNVINKIDLHPLDKYDRSKIYLSAKTGEGLDSLIDYLKILSGSGVDEEGEFLARTRHLECIHLAKEHLRIAQQTISCMNLEITAEELRLAGLQLGEIVGQTLPDELLGKIFTTFCIGK